MEVTVRAIRLKKEFFTVSGPNLQRVGLFNQNTQLIPIDPTVFNPIDAVSGSTIDSVTQITNSDLTLTAANYLDTTWSSNGWDLTTDAAIERQVRGWVLKNLNSQAKFADLPFKESEIHTVWMRGIVSGNPYTVVFAYKGNSGPVLQNPLQNNSIDDYIITTANGGTVQFNAGCLTHNTTVTSGSTAKAAQNYTTVAGVRYRFKFKITFLTGEDLRMEAYDLSFNQAGLDFFSTAGTYEFEFIANNTTTQISWQPNGLSSNVVVCPISFSEAFGPYLLNEDQSLLLTEDVTTIFDSYSAPAADADYNYSSTSAAFGYSFTSDFTGTMETASIRIYRSNTPVGNLYMEIYNGNPSSGGSLIGTSENLNVNTLNVVPDQAIFTFSNKPALTQSTVYHAVVRLGSLTTLDGTNRINHATTASDSMPGAVVYTSNTFPSPWTAQPVNSTTFEVKEYLPSEDLLMEQ